MMLCLNAGKYAEADPWFVQTMDWLKDACGEVPDRGRDPQCFLYSLSSSWSNLEAYSAEDLRKALTTNPQTPPYVSNVVTGWFEMDAGIAARGDAWPSDVTSKQWQEFDAHLEAAQKAFVAAWKQHPEFPQAPTSMIVVARGLNRAELAAQQVWFTRAISAQVDYQDAYDNFLMSLRPRWGGSYEKMEQFGQACLATGRFDTGVPWQYVSAVRAVFAESNHTRGLDRPGVYEQIARVYDGYLKTAETDEDRDCYRTELAGFAWYTHHYAEARPIFDALGDRAQDADLVGYKFGASLAEIRAQTYAMTGPAADLVRRADTIREEGPVVKARSLYQTALTRDKNPRAALYLNYRLAKLEARERFARGEWVDFFAGPDLLGWEPTSGKWEREPDGALLGTSDENGLYLIDRTTYDSHLEIEGEIEYVHIPCHMGGPREPAAKLCARSRPVSPALGRRTPPDLSPGFAGEPGAPVHRDRRLPRARDHGAESEVPPALPGWQGDRLHQRSPRARCSTRAFRRTIGAGIPRLGQRLPRRRRRLSLYELAPEKASVIQ